MVWVEGLCSAPGVAALRPEHRDLGKGGMGKEREGGAGGRVRDGIGATVPEAQGYGHRATAGRGGEAAGGGVEVGCKREGACECTVCVCSTGYQNTGTRGRMRRMRRKQAEEREGSVGKGLERNGTRCQGRKGEDTEPGRGAMAHGRKVAGGR